MACDEKSWLGECKLRKRILNLLNLCRVEAAACLLHQHRQFHFIDSYMLFVVCLSADSHASVTDTITKTVTTAVSGTKNGTAAAGKTAGGVTQTGNLVLVTHLTARPPLLLVTAVLILTGRAGCRLCQQLLLLFVCC